MLRVQDLSPRGSERGQPQEAEGEQWSADRPGDSTERGDPGDHGQHDDERDDTAALGAEPGHHANGLPPARRQPRKVEPMAAPPTDPDEAVPDRQPPYCVEPPRRCRRHQPVQSGTPQRAWTSRATGSGLSARSPATMSKRSVTMAI